MDFLNWSRLKCVFLKEGRWEGVCWIHLAQNRHHWWIPANKVTNSLVVLQKTWEYLEELRSYQPLNMVSTPSGKWVIRNLYLWTMIHYYEGQVCQHNNFSWCNVIFVGRQCVLMTIFWCLEFWGGFWDWEILCTPGQGVRYYPVTSSALINFVPAHFQLLTNKSLEINDLWKDHLIMF